LQAYPHGLREGYFPYHVLKKHLRGNVKEIEKKVLREISKAFKEKRLFPSLEHV